MQAEVQLYTERASHFLDFNLIKNVKMENGWTMRPAHGTWYYLRPVLYRCTAVDLAIICHPAAWIMQPRPRGG
jgi:predicted nucleotidyltransferase